jgi:predicted RND superfamily exporter protein
MMKFARWMIRHPVAVIGANLLATVLLGYYALQIRVESSVASVLPADDPQVEYYAKVRKIFGSSDAAVVGVRAGDAFAVSTLEKIARVTDALAKIGGVSWVLSVTNVPDLTEDLYTKPRLLP